ncbi:hypothetical protein V8E36_007984 [Tilletia maclaganii]
MGIARAWRDGRGAREAKADCDQSLEIERQEVPCRQADAHRELHRSHDLRPPSHRAQSTSPAKAPRTAIVVIRGAPRGPKPASTLSAPASGLRLLKHPASARQPVTHNQIQHDHPRITPNGALVMAQTPACPSIPPIPAPAQPKTTRSPAIPSTQIGSPGPSTVRAKRAIDSRTKAWICPLTPIPHSRPRPLPSPSTTTTITTTSIIGTTKDNIHPSIHPPTHPSINIELRPPPQR